MEENKEEKTKSEDVLPSEAVEAFARWLNTRHIPITLSATEKGLKIHGLVNRFIRSQGWEPSRHHVPERFKPFPEEDTHEMFKGIIESNKLNHESGTDPHVLASHLIRCLKNYESTQIQATKKG